MTEELTYIAEGLRVLAVPIDELHIDPANARTGHALERIAASLKAYGQRKPIIANRLQSGKIEAGNGTWQAAKQLGWSHIAVVYVEDDPATAIYRCRSRTLVTDDRATTEIGGITWGGAAK